MGGSVPSAPRCPGVGKGEDMCETPLIHPRTHQIIGSMLGVDILEILMVKFFMTTAIFSRLIMSNGIFFYK